MGTERWAGPKTALLAREHEGKLQSVSHALLTLPVKETDLLWPIWSVSSDFAPCSGLTRT